MEDLCLPRPDPSDEVLVAYVVRRDVAAFGMLYDRYGRAVYALAAHMLKGNEAEEVVQDVFLHLWRKADQFDPTRGPFKPWFMTVARHRLLDRLRQYNRQQRLVAAEEVDHLLAQAAAPVPDVSEEAWQREWNAAISQALKNLSDEQRRALVLAYFGGLSHSAIAQQFGWPLGTVKKQIQLGLRKLRAALVQHDPTDQRPKPAGKVVENEV